MAEHHSNGGKARAAKLTSAERHDIASDAAKARWKGRDPELDFLAVAAKSLAGMDGEARLRVLTYLKQKFPNEWPRDPY